MAVSEDERLDRAYKYPFLKDSKKIIEEINPPFSYKHMEEGKLRVEKALLEKRIAFYKTNIREVKYAHLMSYVYARMLVSAIGRRGEIMSYADAESKRSAEALRLDGEREILSVSAELGGGLAKDEYNFSMPFEKYLEFAPDNSTFGLSMQELDHGRVIMNEGIAVGILRRVIRKEILKNLPIPRKELPREIIAAASGIKLPEVKLEGAVEGPRKYIWIEKLLATPIPDVRHRTVNLILAPYLTNVRKMGEADAARVIIEYINRCKEIEPNTNVNESYIRYQCKYAKSRGMKPMSLENARELFGGVIDLDELSKS
jgi:hypothetical protein